MGSGGGSGLLPGIGSVRVVESFTILNMKWSFFIARGSLSLQAIGLTWQDPSLQCDSLVKDLVILMSEASKNTQSLGWNIGAEVLLQLQYQAMSPYAFQIIDFASLTAIFIYSINLLTVSSQKRCCLSLKPMHGVMTWQNS